MRIVEAKHAEAQAKKEGKAASTEERNQAKVMKVAHKVTKGAKRLKALELFGTPKLNNLTVYPTYYLH